MEIETYATYREIISQPEAWQQALDNASLLDLPAASEFDQVLFTGCGSTYYLSLAAAALYQELSGRPARAVPGGELLLNPLTVLAQDPRLRTLLVAISRSGTTTETLCATQAFKEAGRGKVLVVSNYPEKLSALGDWNLLISKGQEESVAQTRSFASMYLATAALAARMAGRPDLLESMARLPEIGRRLLSDHERNARRIGEDLQKDRFYFLGSGIRYGLACEVNLKMKEMTLTHSEPFHFLEFRHGPMSMAGEGAVVVGLLSEQNNSQERAVLEEMRALGAEVFSLGEAGADIAFHSSVPEAARAVLYLPVLQLLAFYRSLAKGLNPDRPKNLTAVVILK